MQRHSPAPDWLGFIGAVLTATANVLLVGSGYTPHFIGAACLFWTGFIIGRVRSNRLIVRQWGFRCDNLLAASIMPLIGFVIGTAFLAAIAAWHDRFTLPAHLLPLFLVYPVWGV